MCGGSKRDSISWRLAARRRRLCRPDVVRRAGVGRRQPDAGGIRAVVAGDARARAFDDWHWAIVGGGSLGATFVSTLLLSVMLALRAGARRGDSLSALLTNLGSPAGALFVCASPTGDATGRIVLQVENGRPTASRTAVALMSSPSARLGQPRRNWSSAFGEAVTRTGGRVVPLAR